MEGKLLFIDKPKGITSFDVIRILRKKLDVRKMGHAGTLDPMASGLLIIAIGDATKELTKLIGLPKTYEAEVLLGKKTDSADLEGKVIEERPVPPLSREIVEKVLEEMSGEIELPVPIYSAIKKAGKPLYKYARKGEAVEAPVKVMKVMNYELMGLEENVIKVKWEVGSGTYIRSLAEELGKRLGTVAVLQNLRRTKIGDYKIEDAQPLSF